MEESKQLEEAAARGYQAYCESARPFMPSMYVPDWSLLPEAMKTAWKAAAKAIRSSR